MTAGTLPGRGFDRMSPELARNARKALSLTHTRLGREIGERGATVMRYELGKPVGPEIVDKLRAYFQSARIQVLRDGRVARYQVSPTRPGED